MHVLQERLEVRLKLRTSDAGLGVLILGGVLSGCAAMESLDAYAKAEEQRKEEARVSVARVACERYGFRPATDASAQCIQSEVNSAKNRQAAEAAARRAEPVLPTTTSCNKNVMCGLDCVTK